jgi:hypothetical protein
VPLPLLRRGPSASPVVAAQRHFLRFRSPAGRHPLTKARG